MKLYIKQKVFAIGDKFNVTDAEGQIRYTVEGELISLGKRLHIFDSSHRELALVKQKLLTLLPRFLVLVNGQETAQIARKMAMFRSKFLVEGLGWEVIGEVLQHDYTIRDNGRTIAAIHKKWMSWGDSYEMDIADDADEITALAVVLAIDAVLDADQAAASAASSN